jgi:hypothetical protein
MRREHNYYEMYRPNSGNTKWLRNLRRFRLNKFLRRNLNFNISHEITEAIPAFLFASGIGLILNYVYYSFISLEYLFIGGVNQWFDVLRLVLNYGISIDYNLLYIIINGLYYFYLYSTTIVLLWAIVRKLHRLSTWVFLILVILGIKLLLNIFPMLL